MEDLGEPRVPGGLGSPDPELAAGLELQEVGVFLGMLQRGWWRSLGGEAGCLSERFAKNGEPCGRK